MATANLICLPNLYPRPLPRNPLQCKTAPRVAHVTGAISSLNACSTNKRKSANYQPTLWSYEFVQSLNNDNLDKLYEDKAEKLEQQVRHIANGDDIDFLSKLEFIDELQRLGLGHRFEGDITKLLDGYSFLGEHTVAADMTLHATALSFRLLRQHGYDVSQDVFKAFQDDHEGGFKKCLCKDVRGLLSLYEASALAFEEEDILDEALAFASFHLRKLHRKPLDSSTSGQLSHALELPLHHRMQRLETRWHLEEYSKRDDANTLLLELAMLDFDIVQAIHKRDLKDSARWWKDIGLAKNLSFARDRLMECFFWTVGMAPKPQFSNCRKGLTKVTSLITTIDDVYDVYATLNEIELFTAAVERWDINATKNLPDYMQLCFLALYNTVNEMAYDTLKEHGQYVLPYLTKAWADLCKAFQQEAKWSHNKTTPTFNDYMENAWVSVSGLVILIHAYFLTTENITTEALQSLQNYHDLLRWPSIIFRLCNDLGTSSAELENGETASSVLCCMQETAASEKVAREYVSRLIKRSWKKLNRCQASDSLFSKDFVETAINLARISESTYQHGDGHGAPDDRSKNRVRSLIINPINAVRVR